MWLIGMKRLSQMHWTGHIPWRIVQSITIRRKTAFLLLLSASFAFAAPKEFACKWSPSFSPFDCRLMVIFDRAQSRRVSYAYALWSGPHIIMFCFLSGGTSTRPLESSLLLDSCNVIVCLLETKSGIHCPFIALISLANLLMRLLGLLPHMLLLQLVVRPWVSHSNYNLISSLDADHLTLFTSTWRSELAF